MGSVCRQVSFTRIEPTESQLNYTRKFPLNLLESSPRKDFKMKPNYFIKNSLNRYRMKLTEKSVILPEKQVGAL